MAQRRLSSFKHSDQDYYNDPTIRAAYLSPTAHWLSIWVPFAGFLLILGGVWGLTIATQVSKDHMIEVRSEHFYNFAVDWPTVLVAAYTFISSILNSILLWCFGCAVLSYARYRLSLGRPISLRGLSALTSAKDGQFALHPLGSRWFWLCMFCWSAFLATTAGFNTIILPTRRVVGQDITATELDMTTPAFADFYASNAARYYDCSRWTSIRGLMLSPCPAGTSFTATTYAGRAQYESAELNELTYIRLGSLTFTGSSWGTFPYTSFNVDDSNVFQSAGQLKRFPGARQNFSISLETQGLRASIACSDVATSPISMDAASTAPLACNTRTPVATINPTLRMRAGYCLSGSNGDKWDGLLYNFYMRFAGEYIHTDATGIPHNENITCTIQPFVTTELAQFHSFDNSTWVTQRKGFNADEKVYPQALVERILDNLVDMMVIFGQNSVDNLMAEQFVQLTTSYANGAYQTWPLVAQRQMEGMFAYLASTERVLAESITASSPAMDRVTVNGTLSHDTFAYAVDYPSYLLLIPITIASFLGMFLLIKSASFRHIPRFDPLSVTSLAVASSATGHSLYLDESALKGASPDDESANDAHVSFVRDEHTGQWGLQRVPI